jgi:hypothetical protein
LDRILIIGIFKYNKKIRDMKKREVLALAVIGVTFVGMTLLAFGNPIGVFVVGGALMSGQLMII